VAKAAAHLEAKVEAVAEKELVAVVVLRAIRGLAATGPAHQAIRLAAAAAMLLPAEERADRSH